MVQKLAHVDTVVGNREYQINKCVYQTSEWKSNCRRLEEEANTLKQTFEGLLELKDKDSHEAREQVESLQNEYNSRVSEMEKSHNVRIEELESQCAYYRDQVSSMSGSNRSNIDSRLVSNVHKVDEFSLHSWMNIRWKKRQQCQ